MALTTTEEALVRQLIEQNAELLNLATNEATIISKLAATKKNLGQLTAASSVADTDISFVRQGTADKSASLATLRGYMKPDLATETTTGVVELATTAEVQAGTDSVRAVTPAGLVGRTATETRAGLVELATAAEAQGLTDAVRALSPAGLASAFGGANRSIAESGYQKLPSGLIIQWVQGATSTAGEVSAVVTLPITFPMLNLFSSVSSLNATAAPSADTHYHVVSKTTSQVTVFRQQNPPNSVALAPLVFAIGY